MKTRDEHYIALLNAVAGNAISPEDIYAAIKRLRLSAPVQEWVWMLSAQSAAAKSLQKKQVVS
jgi:hypothetical protein